MTYPATLVLASFLTVLASARTASLAAREYAPRVVSPHTADAYSMRTFRQFPQWRELQGDALAWEVYKYLVDTRTGVFHMNEILEGDDLLGEYRTVRDPVKIINVYGYGYCAIFGPLMAGIWRDMGQGDARTVVLPGWGHVASEVAYDGGWHYLDLDVRAAFRRPDGTLASLDETRRDASLWTGRGPLFFPNDALDSTRRIYERTAVHHYHGFSQSGHTMDFMLRQGESLTRWWQPRDGRWHHAPEYNSVDWLMRLIESPPRGPKPNHRHFTVHNHANGRFLYQPDLTDRSSDFADGVWDFQNVQPAHDGLRLVEPGEGFAIFETRTPYIIVPRVGRADTQEDDCEASVVELDGDGAALSLSRDGGRTWEALPPAASCDLTRWTRGTYGYLLKLTLRGEPSGPVARRLQITTWVQVAPAALPALHQGRNCMEYRSGDHYGLATRVLAVESRAHDREDLARMVTELPADYDPARQTGRILGPLTVPVDAPPRTRIAWFTAEGSFRTHLHQAAARTANRIAYAVDRPSAAVQPSAVQPSADGAADAKPPAGSTPTPGAVVDGLAPPASDPQFPEFREVYRAAVPADTEHWHYNAHAEVRLRRPATRLYVRYVGDPALNNFRIFAHCLDEHRPSRGPVEITHVWREGGERREQTAQLDRPGSYELLVGSDPENESITLALPSCP